MKKILRITSRILGIVLLVLVGGLLLARQREPQAVLLVAGSETGTAGDVGIYAWQPQLEHTWLLVPNGVDASGSGWSADKTWYYIVKSGSVSQVERRSGEVWRVRADAHEAERVLDSAFVYGATRTPDDQWWVYSIWDHTYDYDLFRIRHDGGDTQNLTANFAPSLVLDGRQQFWISTDAQWVFFLARTGIGSDGETHLYRMPLVGGVPQPLKDVDEPYGVIEGWLGGGEWLLVRGNRSLYRVRADGSDVQPLLPDPPENAFEAVLAWVPTHDIFVIRVERGLAPPLVMGIDQSTLTVLWEYEALDFLGVAPNETWLLLQGTDRTIYRMRPDGQALEQVFVLRPDNQFPQRIYYDAPNGRSITYQLFDDDSRQYTLYRVEVETGEVLPIFQAPEELYIAAWSPDAEWVLVGGLAPESRRFWWMRADGTEVRSLDTFKWVRFITWLPPLDRAWTPAALTIMGIVLANMALIPRRYFKRKRSAL